ncbi:MAG: peptidoglycan-binding domain-containing protein [Pseudomonadota bacterium]
MAASRFLRRIGLAALSAGLLVTPATAGDAEGRYAPKGAGLMPCQVFLQQLQSQQPDAAGVAIVWLTGYLSAANAFLDDTYDLVTWQNDGILANVLATRCAQNPNRPIAAAANEVVQALGAGRLKTAEQPERIKVGEREMVLYPSVIRQLQQALKDNGQNIVVDGDFGPGTSNAIKAYQASKGIPQSGFPDALTMIGLFTGQVPQAPAP